MVPMTTRNLNRTWRDVVFSQFETDVETNAPFPITYLIYATPWNRDIIITISTKITPETFRREILDFFIKRDPDPTFRCEHITIRPRVSAELNKGDGHDQQNDSF